MLGWAKRIVERRRRAGRLGARGEREAAKRLRRMGFRILAKNVRSGMGEVDLIALDPDGRTVVFVEVKTRVAGGGARGEASVGVHKRAKLRALALREAKRRGWGDRPLRIDVVGVDWAPDGGGAVAVRWHRGAVSG